MSPALLHSLNNPVRRQILRILSKKGTVLSPSEIQRQLLIDLPHVAYHIRALFKLQILTCTSTRRLRGSTQHFYTSSVVDNRLVKNILTEMQEDDSALARCKG